MRRRERLSRRIREVLSKIDYEERFRERLEHYRNMANYIEGKNTSRPLYSRKKI